MAKQKTKLIDPVDVDPNGLAEAQAVAGAGNITLNGALISGGVFTGDYARIISITSDGADSGRTFTLTGTDPDGKAQTEDVTGPATATVESSSYWTTVTSIYSDAACAGNISSGTVDEIATNTVPLDKYCGDPATVSCENLSGVIDFTIQECYTDFQNKTTAIQWYDVTNLTQRDSVSANDLDNHASGVRLITNSYTSGAQLDFVINQNRSLN